VGAMAKSPQYSDSTDVIRLLRVATWFGPACFVMLSGLWYFMWDKDGFGTAFPLPAHPDCRSHRAIFVNSSRRRRGLRLLVKTIFATGHCAATDVPTPGRGDRPGQVCGRGGLFSDHLTIEPRLPRGTAQLAHLLEMRLKRYDEAERLYLGDSQCRPARARSNRCVPPTVIDLYRKLGRTGRLKVELARFVECYQGSPLTAGAARELKELKEIDLPANRRAPPRKARPNAVSRSRSPFFRRPSANASSSAIGTKRRWCCRTSGYC